jgi:hypothetical protein
MRKVPSQGRSRLPGASSRRREGDSRKWKAAAHQRTAENGKLLHTPPKKGKALIRSGQGTRVHEKARTAHEGPSHQSEPRKPEDDGQDQKCILLIDGMHIMHADYRFIYPSSSLECEGARNSLPPQCKVEAKMDRVR